MPQPNKGDRQGVTLRLPAHIYRELKIYCATEDLKMGDALVPVVVEWWEKHPKRETYKQVAEANTKK